MYVENFSSGNTVKTNFVTGGGSNTWLVALTGLKNNVPNADGSSSSISPTSSPITTTTPPPATFAIPASPAMTEAPSVVTMGGATIIVTATNQAAAPATVTATAKGSSSKGPNTAGIAAGVVVSVLAISAILGGVWFFLRSRRRRSVEEEYRRNAAINNFTGSSKPGSEPSLSDSRLEPSVMMQRRMSDGSIADNHDYSRRILKVCPFLRRTLIHTALTWFQVTNPDGT